MDSSHCVICPLLIHNSRVKVICSAIKTRTVPRVRNGFLACPRLPAGFTLYPLSPRRITWLARWSAHGPCREVVVFPLAAVIARPQFLKARGWSARPISSASQTALVATIVMSFRFSRSHSTGPKRRGQVTDWLGYFANFPQEVTMIGMCRMRHGFA